MRTLQDNIGNYYDSRSITVLPARQLCHPRSRLGDLNSRPRSPTGQRLSRLLGLDMSRNLNSLQGFFTGLDSESIIGVIKGDTRSSDYSSDEVANVWLVFMTL